MCPDPQPIVPVAPGSAHEMLARPQATAPGVTIPYNGGKLIQKVDTYSIYWGSAWIKDAGQAAVAHALDSFIAAFVQGSYLDDLGKEYSHAPYTISHGVFHGPGIVVGTDPPNPVTDAQIQTQLTACIAQHHLQQTENTLFIVMIQPGTSVVAPWGQPSCGSGDDCWTGYHWATSAGLYYAVVPECQDAMQQTNLNAVDYFRMVLSHEICEAITDPIFQTGWYSDQTHGNQDEIGDPCAWRPKQFSSDGGVIQQLWSNKANGGQGGCV